MSPGEKPLFPENRLCIRETKESTRSFRLGAWMADFVADQLGNGLLRTYLERAFKMRVLPIHVIQTRRIPFHEDGTGRLSASDAIPSETRDPDTRHSQTRLTLPTPKGGGFLRGTHSRELYSQRVRQKPSSHSLDIESVVTFAQDVGRSVGLGME